MYRRTFLANLGALATGAMFPALAEGAYPTRPIEFVVPWGPGGGSDQTARKLAQILEPKLGVSLPIVNIPGGSGVAGLLKVLASPPDGYSLYLMAADTIGVLAMTKQKWSLDDITPLAILTQQRSALFVKQDGPLATWADIDKTSKEREIKVAISSLGTPEEAAVNFFKRRGNKFVGVPYARPGERYSALLGGHVDLLFEQAGDIRSFIDGKQIRPVLILSDAPSPEFPEVPASKKVGVDLVLDQYRGLFVKSGTDPKIVAKLTEKVRDAVASKEYADYLQSLWADGSSYLPPEKARVYIESDIVALKAVN